MPTPDYMTMWANLPDWMKAQDGQYNDYQQGNEASMGQAYNDFMWWLQNTQGGQVYAQQNPYWQQQLANPQTFPTNPPPETDGPGDHVTDDPTEDPPPPPPTNDPYKTQASQDALNRTGTGGRFNRPGGPGVRGPRDLNAGQPRRNFNNLPPGMTPRNQPAPPPGGGSYPGTGIGIDTSSPTTRPPVSTTPAPGTQPVTSVGADERTDPIRPPSNNAAELTAARTSQNPGLEPPVKQPASPWIDRVKKLKKTTPY